MTKMPLLTRVVSLYFVISMLFFIGFAVFKPVNVAMKPITVNHETSESTSTVAKAIIDGEPIALTIEKLNIDLPIKFGAFDSTTDSWTLSDDSVYFAQVTKLPNNQGGNTFLYGHNTKAVLEPLSGLSVGDKAIIKTANGYAFIYSYTGDAVIPPNLTSVLNDSPEWPRLTIMTCDGVWSQARRLMYFDFVEVD